jgi:monofunctional biosynthetic peptidoglycan transglycosylase
MLIWEAAMALSAALVLTDFTPGTDPGWTVVNDGVMGGRSDGAGRLEAGQLRFEGVLRTQGGGFASLRSGAVQHDLSAFAGIRVHARGDGRTYSLRLRSRSTTGMPFQPVYQGRFTPQTVWSDTFVPFSDLVVQWRGRRLTGPPFDASGVTGLGLMINDKQDGPFALDVRRIEAVPWARIDDLSTARPLVIFAPARSDARVQTQLKSIAQTQGAFDERHMRVMLITEDGQSRLDDLPIAPANVARLRARHSVAKGDFAVHLVGKDGGIKHRSKTVVALASLYALIDSMPMRQAEMRR